MSRVKNAEALSWRHPGVEGIRTKGGEITAWPLGPIPDQSTVDTWDAEYKAFLAGKEDRKNIPNEANDRKPVTWGDLNRVLDVLREQGVIV